MAKDLKFQGAMMLFGTVIVAFIAVYTICCIFLTEGLTSDQKEAINQLKPTHTKCDDLYGLHPIPPSASASAPTAPTAPTA